MCHKLTDWRRASFVALCVCFLQSIPNTHCPPNIPNTYLIVRAGVIHPVSADAFVMICVTVELYVSVYEAIGVRDEKFRIEMSSSTRSWRNNGVEWRRVDNVKSHEHHMSPTKQYSHMSHATCHMHMNNICLHVRSRSSPFDQHPILLLTIPSYHLSSHVLSHVLPRLVLE